MRGSAVACLLAWVPTCSGQTVTLPAEVKAEPGRLGSIQVSYDGDDFRYTSPQSIDVFREYHPDPKVVKLRFIAYYPGTYQISCITCKTNKLSEFGNCNVIVGKPVPPTPVPPAPPDPPPPDPNPPTPPAPIPASGLRVLITYETSELNKLPTAQASIIYSKTVRDYLNSKCVVGPDAKTKEWRIYDKDVDASAESKVWQEAMKRPRTGLPWIVISDGKQGFEGPLPKNVEDTMTLLKKYGG